VSLVIANLVTIGLALSQGWDLEELMFIYWAQSVIIGVFTYARMMSLRKFSTRGMTSGGFPEPETTATKHGTANFFTFHFGFFHLIYFGFLVMRAPKSLLANLPFLILGVVVFAANHGYTFLKHRKRDALGKPGLAGIMIFPYIRIVPMHLTLMVAIAVDSPSPTVLVLFLVLKTCADVVMDWIELATLPESQPA